MNEDEVYHGTVGSRYSRRSETLVHYQSGTLIVKEKKLKLCHEWHQEMLSALVFSFPSPLDRDEKQRHGGACWLHMPAQCSCCFSR